MLVDEAMRIHATQDEIGCRVIVHNLKSRPALNRLAGTIVSLDHKPGGCRDAACAWTDRANHSLCRGRI